jgi:hypothetical protein
LRRLQQQQAVPERIDSLCRDEIRWINSAQGLNGCTEKYEACVRLITDLAKLRWRIIQDGFDIELATPNRRKVLPSEINSYKETIRKELASQLHQQFNNKSVRDFIQKMEKPTPITKKRSVLDLVADGRELRERLLAASEAQGTDRINLCGTAVRPYLQLVENNLKDDFTGHLLSDIWRYFRFTWTIPATNVPGRNLFYLIRDAAHPNHAVMGITALSNAPLALRDRDNNLGWTATTTQTKVLEISSLPEAEAKSSLTSLLNDLEDNLQQGLDSISFDKLLTLEEANNPTETVIERLKRRAAEFSSKREGILSATELPLALTELEQDGDADPAVSDEILELESKVFGEKMNAARRAMTAKKRAAELARLLQARLTLRKYREKLVTPVLAPSAYASEAVASAVNASWYSAKNARAGTSMLEITVCGAVRPYNHILGGKLATLLMLSPQVLADYTRRYGGAVSIISSMMKNEPVVKDSRLVFLGTTSLYLHGASQYNRVRLPAGIISSEQSEIRYEPMGETGGFGTVQFSPDTVAAVEKVVTSSKGYREVNSVFGEGRSPKLRKLHSGLDQLGFDSQLLLQHHQSRIIYGVKLFPDTAEFLRSGRGEMPDFIREPERFRDGTERIARFWRERWLCSRLDHTPLLETLSGCPAWSLSQSIPVEEHNIKEIAPHKPEIVTVSANASNETDTRLWESLAQAGHDTCSDCVSEDDLDRLHVPSDLEDFIVKRVSEGYSLILTGNAGDGKTHLLRRIAPALKMSNAVVDLDATAVMRKGKVEPILERWRSALDSGRPYCIAANEYPLHRLIRAGKKVLPDAIHAELVRQNHERLSYSPKLDDKEKAQEKLLIVDLSLRNPLIPSFSIAALRKMLMDSAVLSSIESSVDSDFTWNHRKLSSPQVQERLGELFQRLADKGHRCTIRELWICLARLLFGDPSERRDGPIPTGSHRTWYSSRLWTLPSSGIRFRLGNLLLNEADPAAASHPHWDLELEHAAEMDYNSWADGIPAIEVGHPDPKKSLERFAYLKRRFYFEHKKGDQVFKLKGRQGSEFSSLLKDTIIDDDDFKARILKDINHAYCPRAFAGSDRDLYLWFSHRYHEQPTRSYVASRLAPANSFKVRLPRLPSRLNGAFDYRPDHLLLEYEVNDRKCHLQIDSAMYAVLVQMRGGLPRHLASDRELNKLDNFLSHLQRIITGDTRRFLIYSGENRIATRVTMDENFTQYSQLERL